jgi:predicted amidohydrolase
MGMDWLRYPLDRELSHPERELRVAVVQLRHRPDGPDLRLARAAALVRDCAQDCHPNLIVLPDALTGLPGSATEVGRLAGPVAGQAFELLRRLASDVECAVGGGFIASRSGHPRSLYCLAEPDGRVHLHELGRPAPAYARYVRGGQDDGYASTASLGVVGLVAGHDWWRSPTARRLRGGVGLLAGGGSCSGVHALTPLPPAVRRRIDARDHELARAAAPTLARLVGAPAVVACEVGEGMLGESQIVDAEGRELARARPQDGDAWTHADLALVHPLGAQEPVSDWTGEETRAFRAAWLLETAAGRALYRRGRRAGRMVAMQDPGVPDGLYLPPFEPDTSEREMIMAKPATA